MADFEEEVKKRLLSNWEKERGIELLPPDYRTSSPSNRSSHVLCKLPTDGHMRTGKFIKLQEQHICVCCTPKLWCTTCNNGYVMWIGHWRDRNVTGEYCVTCDNTVVKTETPQ